jgi:hypothetical protein
LLIVLAETPAFDKPSTEEYGRPAMIFFAVAAPTPGNSTKSFSLAVFKSSLAPEAEELPAAEFEFFGFGVACAASKLELVMPSTNNIPIRTENNLKRDFDIRSSLSADSFEQILRRQIRQLRSSLAKHVFQAGSHGHCLIGQTTAASRASGQNAIEAVRERFGQSGFQMADYNIHHFLGFLRRQTCSPA